MPETFKALVINQDGENFSQEVKELNFDFLNEGEVLVKIQYSDLNYKDALILKDGAKLVKEFPRIPGIDFSGTVAESKSDEFKDETERTVADYKNALNLLKKNKDSINKQIVKCSALKKTGIDEIWKIILNFKSL